jgi:hypothetical protein
MKTQQVNINKLTPHPENPKIHTEQQIQHIADNIKRFDWVQPIVIDDNNQILAGHGRVLAATKLGLEKVPAVYAKDLNESQKRAYLAFDNTSNLETGFDKQLMEQVYSDLHSQAQEIENGPLGTLMQDFRGIDWRDNGESDDEGEEETGGGNSGNYIKEGKKQLVFYFEPWEAEEVEEKLEGFLDDSDYSNREDLLLDMVRNYLKKKGDL